MAIGIDLRLAETLMMVEMGFFQKLSFSQHRDISCQHLIRQGS
jgi:hypothetical protein